MQVKIPVSIGELFDKISILKIKTKHIKDDFALKNIEREYKLLLAIAIKIDPNFQKTSGFKSLHKINIFLWKVEDEKRDHERRKDFGKSFIEWARRVYIYNDKRAKTKKDINLKYGSMIVEEKSYQKY